MKVDADRNIFTPYQPTIEWDKTFGGSNGDGLSSIIPTPDGGYLLADYSSSPASGDKSEHSKDEDDYWVVKVDAQGNKVWDKTIGGIGKRKINDFRSAILTPDGGFLLGGTSDADASGDKSGDSKGVSDYWIVKLKEHTTPVVTGLTLVDAETDQDIKAIKEGDIINLAQIGSALLNIRTNLSAGIVDHVELKLTRLPQTSSKFCMKEELKRLN